MFCGVKKLREFKLYDNNKYNAEEGDWNQNSKICHVRER